ncbi:hypothetical protein QYE76_071093 [Lolium multiflorum]|uniref:Reverse transcriptase/retrotransposon-derived protein RNase H-like domain-containing protein n=1 Tax=Lolium multiflorum TaxID=4521 RepID=A0AAD8SKM8_LOLMU|nr:hypothetical protein QYE76_071093 [Lolium multiflorum]
MKPPTTKKELQRLIGKINFVRRFISNLSGRIEPFMGLVKIKSDDEFHWGAEQQRAFDEIKEYLTKPPVLVPPPAKTGHSTFTSLMSDSIEDVTELRLWSLEKIKENKAKVARAYNKKVRPKEFHLVWEVVLPLGTKDAVYGKWSPNWHEPYRVDQVLKGNASMLEQLDGVKFQVVVNGQHLKKYFPRSSPPRGPSPALAAVGTAAAASFAVPGAVAPVGLHPSSSSSSSSDPARKRLAGGYLMRRRSPPPFLLHLLLSSSSLLREQVRSHGKRSSSPPVLAPRRRGTGGLLPRR